MRRKRSLLCRSRTKLLYNYPRRVLEGIREGGGRWQRQVMHRHRLRVRIRCPPQGRSRRIYDLMILRRVGETVLLKSTRKFPSRLVFMYEKYPARMDDDEAAATSCSVHLNFWRCSVLHIQVLLGRAINASTRELLEEGGSSISQN